MRKMLSVITLWSSWSEKGHTVGLESLRQSILFDVYCFEKWRAPRLHLHICSLSVSYRYATFMHMVLQPKLHQSLTAWYAWVTITSHPLNTGSKKDHIAVTCPLLAWRVRAAVF